MYLYVCICAYAFINTFTHAIIVGKESMNLKGYEEGYMGSLGGRKWKLLELKHKSKQNVFD